MRPLILIALLFFFGVGYSQKDSTKVKELLDIAYTYEKTNLDSAIITYRKAAKLAEKIEYWIGAGRATSYTGILFSDYGMLDSAIVYHERSIPLYEKASYRGGVASSLINLGNVYQFKGDYNKSTDYYFKGIDEYEKINDTTSLIYTYGNLASLLTDFKIYGKSKFYLIKALNFSYNIHDSLSAGYLLNDLGSNYLNLKEKDSALINFNKAQDMAERFDDVELKYYINNNLNNFFISEKDFLKAQDYAIKSYKNSVDINKPYFEGHALNVLGLVNLELNNLDSAYIYAKKGLEIASIIQAKEHIMDAYSTLYKIYNRQNQYEEAYNALELYMAYKDSVVGQQSKEYISRLEQQYQVKNKDNEILKQKLTIEQNEAMIQRKINQSGMYLVGLGILLFTSFLLWYRHQQKQKLHLQSIDTLNKQKELAALEALIEGEDIERSRIAKDLHDSVNGNLSAIKHHLSSISQDRLKKDDNKTFSSAIEMLDNACEQIRNISHDLVPPSLLNYGLIEALEQYINRINTIGLIEISFQHFGTLEPLSKKTETTIYHIIQELIANIVKHSRANKAIVQINADFKTLHITVEDNGLGYDTNTLSHGLGLQNVQSRIEFLNAEMDIKSDSKGTSVAIDINLTKIPQL
jgi:signal transduction histidine kinase